MQDRPQMGSLGLVVPARRNAGSPLPPLQENPDEEDQVTHPNTDQGMTAGSIGEQAAAIRVALYRAVPNMPSYPVGIVEPVLEQFRLSSTAALEAEVERLRAIVARVQQAVAYCPPEDMTAREAAIAADLSAGMSLRQISAKHGVGVGTVRGVKSRTFLQEQEKQNG